MKKLLFLLCILSLVTSCAMFRPSGRSSSELKKEIRELLNDHPELVLEVLEKNKIAAYKIIEQGAREDRENQQQKRWEAELKKPFKPIINDSRPALGYSKAPIVIVSYSDFLCGACKHGSETVEELLQKYPKKLRLIQKHYVFYEFSDQLSLYFEAIGLQSDIKAWKFHDMVYENQEGFQQKKDEDPKKVSARREKILNDILASLKTDRSKLAKDLKSATLVKRIQQDIKEADAFRFNSIPVYLINGVAIRGAAPIEEFEKVIKMIESK